MAYKFKITYPDGRVEEVLPSPRARIEAERQLGGLTASNTQEASYYLAWLMLTKLGKETADFETWVDTIADMAEVEVKDVRPTQPTPPTGPSSD